MAEKKKCPYCDKVLGKAGWNMHYAHKHVERVFKPFEKVGAPESDAQVESFREEPPKRKRTPKPKEREYQPEYRPDEPEEPEEEGGWGLPGTLLDDD